VNYETKNNADHVFNSNLDGALYWFDFGFKVIPVQPKGKVTVVKWDGWLKGLSEEKIIDYWTQHPDHEVGFIVGDSFIVLDADSPESIAKLYEIEKAFDVTPLLITKTKKGVHHFFKRPEGVFAKSDSHSTVDHPDRLDVKTGRALVVLAPSSGKEIGISEVDCADELTEVCQGFVDAVARNNGRSVPRAQQIREASEVSVILSTDHKMLAAILSLISADCGYEDWLQTLMAIYHETGGSVEGLELAITWSSNGQSYKGRADVVSKWESFKSDVVNPITIRSLTKKLDIQGIDWMGGCSESLEPFEACVDDEVSDAANDSDLACVEVCENEEVESVNPFDKFSLRGNSAEIEKNAIEPVYVMEGLAIKGQFTVLFAAPNTGKTLLSIGLLIKAIGKKTIDPNTVFYLNMDDTAIGLLEKNQIATDYGFHMLSEGYLDFTADLFLAGVKEMTSTNTAKGVVVLIDTAKKFVDLMNKNFISAFNKDLRSFVGKGGSVIALTHTNKNLNKNGKSVPGGTSDLLDDCDCAYTLDTVSKDKTVKVVEFENIKRRGNVVNNVSYRYTIEDGCSYDDILESVEKVDDDEVNSIKQAEAIKTDAELIEAVTSTIKIDGVITKEDIVSSARKKVGVSRVKMINLIEKYTGVDPEVHFWSFTKGRNNRHEYHLLSQS